MKKIGYNRKDNFLRKICGAKVNNVTQRYGIRLNEEVYNALGKPNIIEVIKLVKKQ